MIALYGEYAIDKVGDAGSGAVFSRCRRYRYRLWREWDASLQTATFLMMNPSTADEIKNDPTVERCQRRAMAWGGYGRVEVVNVFAWRETDSRKLKVRINEGVDIIGPNNDAAILEACAGAGVVVCAWGNPGNLLDRGGKVISMLRGCGIKPMAFKQNKDGTPQHPLYIGYDVMPKEIV